MIAAHQTMLAPQGAPLPYDAEVEYLESTGTQYIDTGINPDNETDVAGRFELLSANLSFCFGAYTVWNSDTVGLYVGTTGDVLFRVGGTQKSFGRGFQGEIIDFSLVGTDLAVNGTTTTMPLRVSCARTISVFAFSGETSGACRCLEFSVFRSGTLVRSYVPVRVGTVGYLFDRVSGTLFGNAGTGAFVIGPDK